MKTKTPLRADTHLVSCSGGLILPGSLIPQREATSPCWNLWIRTEKQWSCSRNALGNRRRKKGADYRIIGARSVCHTSFSWMFFFFFFSWKTNFMSDKICSRYHFQGPCGTTVPEALSPHPSESEKLIWNVKLRGKTYDFRIKVSFAKRRLILLPFNVRMSNPRVMIWFGCIYLNPLHQNTIRVVTEAICIRCGKIIIAHKQFRAKIDSHKWLIKKCNWSQQNLTSTRNPLRRRQECIHYPSSHKRNAFVTHHLPFLLLTGPFFSPWKKNSSMELAVIWGNFSCSDLACSDLACSDLGHSDLAHSDLARSDLARFYRYCL